jgi:sec-independent protein translocase protein TatA
MGFSSPLHWLIVLAVIILLFGAGRISGVMGDLGKGIKSFKKGLSDDDGAGSSASTSSSTAAADTSRPQPRITDDRPVEHRAPVSQPSADLDKH